MSGAGERTYSHPPVLEDNKQEGGLLLGEGLTSRVLPEVIRNSPGAVFTCCPLVSPARVEPLLVSNTYQGAEPRTLTPCRINMHTANSDGHSVMVWRLWKMGQQPRATVRTPPILFQSRYGRPSDGRDRWLGGRDSSEMQPKAMSHSREKRTSGGSRPLR